MTRWKIFWLRLNRILNRLVPFLLTVFAVLVSAVPIPIPFLSHDMPWWGLMAVVYWAVYRPNLLPPVLVFIIGLGEDFLTGTPTGLHALIYIASYWLIIHQRRFFLGVSFPVLWWAFGMITVAVGIFSWLSFSLLAGAFQPFSLYLIKVIVTATAFPLLAWFLIQSQRAFLPGP